MIRYARGGENPALAALPCTGARYDVLDPVDGARVALVSYGAETEEIIAAKDLLAQHGVQADCVKLTQLYPLPDGVCDTLKHYDTILFAEDTVRTGGIGEQLGFAMQQCRLAGQIPAACRGQQPSAARQCARAAQGSAAWTPRPSGTDILERCIKEGEPRHEQDSPGSIPVPERTGTEP